jgi:hypothetical protein
MPRTIEQIINDWWHAVAPGNRIPRGERLACYVQLFEELKAEGYSRDDLSPGHRSDVADRSVKQDHSDKKKLRTWRRMVAEDMERAESAVFAPSSGISEKARAVAADLQKAKAVETAKRPPSPIPEGVPEPEDSDLDGVQYNLFRPDVDCQDKKFTMDYIREKYAFEADAAALEDILGEGGDDD